MTLFRYDVDDDGGSVIFRLFERTHDVAKIVSVDGADVLDVQVRIQRLVVGETREKTVNPSTNSSIQRPCRTSEAFGDFPRQ